MLYAHVPTPSVWSRDRRTPATTDGGGNTYRSDGNVCVTDAGAVHTHITTAPVGVSPSISGSWSPPIPGPIPFRIASCSRKQRERSSRYTGSYKLRKCFDSKIKLNTIMYYSYKILSRWIVKHTLPISQISRAFHPRSAESATAAADSARYVRPCGRRWFTGADASDLIVFHRLGTRLLCSKTGRQSAAPDARPPSGFRATGPLAKLLIHVNWTFNRPLGVRGEWCRGSTTRHGSWIPSSGKFLCGCSPDHPLCFHF